MLNLIQTFISGSKTVTTLNGKLLPGGSDTTYRLWLTTNAEPIEYPTGDSDIFIDNCGHYIVKSYRVSSVKNPKPNVITACINIPWTKDETGMDGLQQQEELKPCHWMPNAKEKDVQQKMEELISDGKEKFVYYQYRYVYELFNFLASTSNRQMEENIENEIKKLDSTGSRRCENTKCLELYNNRKRKCDICGSKVSKVETEEPEDVNKTFHSVPKYFPLGEKTVSNRVKITMGDIVALNPNSYENLEAILSDLHGKLISNGKKEWISVGSDGPPYTLMRRLIKSKGLDWVTLTSGLGHLNMNQLKTFFAVARYVCFDVLGQDVLNFKTTKAWEYFIACKDNHKSWQSFEVFLHGTSLEFVNRYVAEDPNPTPVGFLHWAKQITSPTQRFLFDLVFNIVLSIYVQRIGDRSNDASVSNCARLVFFDMFFCIRAPYLQGGGV